MWKRRFARILRSYNKESRFVLVEVGLAVDGNLPKIVHLLEINNRRNRRNRISKNKTLGLRTLRNLSRFIKEEPQGKEVHSD